MFNNTQSVLRKAHKQYLLKYWKIWVVLIQWAGAIIFYNNKIRSKISQLDKNHWNIFTHYLWLDQNKSALKQKIDIKN